MKTPQISVFLENKPGRLSEPCEALAQAGIDILTLSLADTEQFGILRLLTKDAPKAAEVLRAAGIVVNVAEVVAVEVLDEPGGLAALLQLMERRGINVEYMYAFTYRRKDRAVMIFRFEAPDAAIAALREEGAQLLSSSELYARAEQRD
jgi:hypothetical protein